MPDTNPTNPSAILSPDSLSVVTEPAPIVGAQANAGAPLDLLAPAPAVGTALTPTDVAFAAELQRRGGVTHIIPGAKVVK